MNKISKPKLLYRASRGGWETADFHRVCDEKGATLTEVKSSEGYIFGGYSSTSWASSGFGCYKESSDTFLFSLKCHVGLSAVRMNLKGSASNAIYCHSSYGSTFGGGDDLYIKSNANTNQGSCSKIGSTYSLPPGTTDPHFLTGQKQFQVSEYELFQV